MVHSSARIYSRWEKRFPRGAHNPETVSSTLTPVTNKSCLSPQVKERKRSQSTAIAFSWDREDFRSKYLTIRK
jgi:hypothetical protein